MHNGTPSVLGKISFTADQIQAADVNHDGRINVSDVTALINIILNVS